MSSIDTIEERLKALEHFVASRLRSTELKEPSVTVPTTALWALLDIFPASIRRYEQAERANKALAAALRECLEVLEDAYDGAPDSPVRGWGSTIRNARAVLDTREVKP
jgi:hypothetical protein